MKWRHLAVGFEAAAETETFRRIDFLSPAKVFRVVLSRLHLHDMVFQYRVLRGVILRSFLINDIYFDELFI